MSRLKLNLSTDFGTKYSMLIILTILTLQSTLGEYFYKFNLYGIFASEFLLLIALLTLILYSVAIKKIPRVPGLYLTIFLATGYLIYSIAILNRELIWVARQFAVFIYYSTTIIGFWFTVKNHDRINWIKTIHAIGLYGLILTILHVVYPVLPGHPGFVSYLMAIAGYSSALYHCRGTQANLTLFLLAIALSSQVGSTGFVIAPIVTSGAIWFLKYEKLRRIILTLGFSLVAILPFLLSGLSDGNAVWRFIYWYDILSASYDRGYFLVGNGFGAPFMSESGENFSKIIGQVSGKTNRDYQLMTVPPHNGVLTLLHLLGAIPLVVLVWQLVKMFKTCVNSANKTQIILFSALSGYLIIFVSTQMSVTPYGAIIFWALFGITLGSTRIIETHKEMESGNAK